MNERKICKPVHALCSYRFGCDAHGSPDSGHQRVQIAVPLRTESLVVRQQARWKNG